MQRAHSGPSALSVVPGQRHSYVTVTPGATTSCEEREMKDHNEFKVIDVAAVELEARRMRAQALTEGFISFRRMLTGKRG